MITKICRGWLPPYNRITITNDATRLRRFTNENKKRIPRGKQRKNRGRGQQTFPNPTPALQAPSQRQSIVWSCGLLTSGARAFPHPTHEPRVRPQRLLPRAGASAAGGVVLADGRSFAVGYGARTGSSGGGGAGVGADGQQARATMSPPTTTTTTRATVRCSVGNRASCPPLARLLSDTQSSCDSITREDPRRSRKEDDAAPLSPAPSRAAAR